AALPGGPQPVRRLRADQLVLPREVLVRPELQLPAGVVLEPGPAVRAELVRQGIRADPDLVEDAGDEHVERLPVIVETSALGALAGQVTMVDGAFDPIHPGHVAYFEAAAALGRPVLCNVSPDEYVSTKHRPFLTQAERGAVLDAFRSLDYVHLSSGSTRDVLAELRPHSYAKG